LGYEYRGTSVFFIILYYPTAIPYFTLLRNLKNTLKWFALIFEVFFKSWKVAKIDQKVKVNPFNFRSILGTVSTLLKSLKNRL
jgi:hypothetical protein